MGKSKLWFVALAIVAVLYVSCDKTKGLLTKSWKVTNIEAKGTMSDSIRNIFISTGTLTFTKDGKVSGTLGGAVSGTYELSKDGKTITVKDANGAAEAYTAEISAESLIMDGKEAKVTFTKQ